MPTNFDALIIGAGHNGLVAAAYLARAGWKVCVLERRPVVGGACVTEEVWAGYKVSTAAYVCSLLLPEVVRELELPRYGFRLLLRNPSSFTPFPDGRYLLLGPDPQLNSDEIAKFSPRDAVTFADYEQCLERISRFIEPILSIVPPSFPEWKWRDALTYFRLLRSFFSLSVRDRRTFIQLMTGSAQDFLDGWFESEQLKITLATDGVIGAALSPSQPGTGYVLLHHVMGQADGHRGVWGYVKSGMGALSQAIADSATAHGAEIRCHCEVAQLIVEGDRAVGVALTDGEEIRARVVLSNADPKRTFLQLTPPGCLPDEFVEQVRRFRMDAAAFKLNLALDGLPSFSCLPGDTAGPQHQGTIHLCPDFATVERAFADYLVGRPSQTPMVEACLPTVADSTLAPEGKHIMSIFAQYAPLDPADGGWEEPSICQGSPDPDIFSDRRSPEQETFGQTFRRGQETGADLGKTQKDRFVQRILDVVETYAPGFRSRIEHIHALSPADLQNEFSLTGGNIFHGNMSLDQLFFLRPVPGWAQYRTPLRGLYLCGSGAHPGGGVTGACGRNAAGVVLTDA